MKKSTKSVLYAILSVLLVACSTNQPQKIDRKALVERNNPKVIEFNKHSSLSVGNGNFAYTVDATGMQTFPEFYSDGVPLGTQSQWGWHSFPNSENYNSNEALKNYNFRGWEEPYAVQFNEAGREQDAANYLRINPHRLHLGYVGLELLDDNNALISTNEIKSINQELNLWEGIINSSFIVKNDSVNIRTAVDPTKDKIAITLNSPLIKSDDIKINFRFPYPTGEHSDDATNWNAPEKHKTEIISQDNQSFIFKRTLDSTIYYLSVNFEGEANILEKEAHYFVLSPQDNNFSFTCEFLDKLPEETSNNSQDVFSNSSEYWISFWENGGVVDFSNCTNDLAPELERRVVLSQYLMAIQSAGMYPPQETGLTYNSWYGKFHLEMHWWHAVHFALWNRSELLERSMNWYNDAYPIAKSIAERQNFEGIRWMKMTDPSGAEAPSKVGSFLIWQQPHFIYMAELLYRNNPSPEVLEKYSYLVEETAKFMVSFVVYDENESRFILNGIIPAQETLRAVETINPPFELSYWHFGLSIAQQWRERLGLERDPYWDEITEQLSELAFNSDGLYLASEDADDTYTDIRFTSDHPAVLGAYGMMPMSKLFREDYMQNTLDWIWDNWNWDQTWGWDYPMTAMNAARLGDREKAVGALLMDRRTNTYLHNGHN